MAVKRILLVEDDPDVRPLMAHVLTGAGYAVDVAEGIAAARALLASSIYDLVLTDGRLPDGSGIDLASEAKGRGAVAVLVTAFPLTYSMEGLDCLMKPVRPSELLLTVRRYIGE